MQQHLSDPVNPFAPSAGKGAGDMPTMICFSHLRWDFVYQRPQHLMTRFARLMRVFYFEEPVIEDGCKPFLDVHKGTGEVMIATPHPCSPHFLPTYRRRR
jgi:UDP-galactopyranose mutase